MLFWSRERENKAGYMTIVAACGWAEAIFEVTIWAGAVREVAQKGQRE